MRLGKIEKEALVTMLNETKKDGLGISIRCLNKEIGMRLDKWDTARVNWGYWKERGLDSESSFRASLSRAYRTLRNKHLVEYGGGFIFSRSRMQLTDKGRLVARGIKIS